MRQRVIDQVSEFEAGPWASVFAAAQKDIAFVSRVLSTKEEEGEGVLPHDKSLIFEPFRLIAPSRVKVVVLGSSPSPSGLAFSVPQGLPVTPEVTAIHRELSRTIPGFSIPTHGDLSAWSEQGVLFLTASLTSREPTYKVRGSACSHGALWYPFLSHVLTEVLASNKNVVFVSWGPAVRDLFSTLSLGDINRLEAPHPGPAFAGCDHFDKINRHLANCERAAAKKLGDEAARGFLLQQIDWQL